MSFSLRNTAFPAASAHATSALVLLTTLVLLPTLAHAQQTITVGMTDQSSASFSPFGPGNGTYDYVAGSEYQELYSGAAFAGGGSPLTIQGIAFASGAHSTHTTATYNLTLRLSTTRAILSTTGADVGRLSTNFAANEGADATVVFSGPLTANIQAQGLFDLVFPTTPFLYDPSEGNLLLDVVLNQTTSSLDGDGFSFLMDTSNLMSTPTQTNRVFQLGGTGAPTFDVAGLYTQFKVSPAAVPEVSTIVSLGLLLALGMGGVVIAAKRKKNDLFTE
ncbi:MAG: hypothetical protein H0U76_19875 [Ktedonobacteraceae bacterium]|nr:hypothetical protein [Ktedonobacteraceae bacterium]